MMVPIREEKSKERTDGPLIAKARADEADVKTQVTPDRKEDAINCIRNEGRNKLRRP